MALTLETASITEQDDGTYTVQVFVKRTADGKIVGKNNFQALDAAQLKAQIKPFFEALVAEERKNQGIQTAAQLVVDEIINEVTQ